MAVWTGAELLVWGGYGVRRGPENAVPAHGMVYDPQTVAGRRCPLRRCRAGPTRLPCGPAPRRCFGGTAQSQYQYQTFTDGAAYKP